MPSSEYYHRQADICVRMALSASSCEERVRLMEVANDYRDRASRGEASGRDAGQVSMNWGYDPQASGAMTGVALQKAKAYEVNYFRDFGRANGEARAAAALT